jgi:hypothetical protein
MADATVVDTYPKATVSKAQVQQIQRNKLNNGAKTCTLTEDSTNWILTTVWPGVGTVS